MTENACPVLCQISQDHVIQLEDVIDVSFVTSEIAVESGIRLHGCLVESLLNLISRHCGMLVKFSSDQKEGIESGGCAAVLPSLELHIHPWISVHQRILAHVVLLGVQHLIIIRVAVELAGVVMEGFR